MDKYWLNTIKFNYQLIYTYIHCSSYIIFPVHVNLKPVYMYKIIICACRNYTVLFDQHTHTHIHTFFSLLRLMILASVDWEAPVGVDNVDLMMFER